MKRTAVALAGVLVLAACGSPSGQAPATYVAAICGAYADFEAQLVAQGKTFAAAQQAANGDPAKIKTADVAFLGGQVTAAQKLTDAVTAQGRPRGTGGDAVRQGFVDAAGRTRDIFARQRDAIAGADPTNRITFFQVLDSAQKQIVAAEQAWQSALENIGAVGDQAINDAAAADKTCASL